MKRYEHRISGQSSSPLFLLLLFIAVLPVLHCRVDHGLAPLPGKVIARVIFRNEPPANTEGIYLMVAPEFPPHAINEMYHSPNSLPIGPDTVITEMALPHGHYKAIALWWYSKETKSNFADVLALPLDASNDLLPLAFDITPEKPEYRIDMYANWNRVNRDASIQGTVKFTGPFPANTMATAVAAYQYEPEESVHYLVWLKAIDFAIGPTSENYNAADFTYRYTLPVRHGDVNYIAVFWLPERAGLTEYRVLGVYPDQASPDLPGKLKINAGDIKTGIDITADWARVR